MENKLEFINLSHPSQGSSSKLQRLAYSHAARVSHARVKHARKVAGLANGVESSIPNTKKGQASEGTVRRDSCLVAMETDAFPIAIPDPLDQLTSSRRDPFGCFARPLSPLEHYLFDHCRLVCSFVHQAPI
ncbi:hypothetical protein V8C35DRAFT_305740 [Trichoderma chlorosporum]